MLVYGLDPGTTQSALVVWDSHNRSVVFHATEDNGWILERVMGQWHDCALVVEQIQSYGMAVGAEVFATVWWAGRFHQAWNGRAYQLPRRDVKLHLCGSARAKDANVRQAILDRFGGKAAAIGTKQQPGPLRGIKAHEFAALAVALTWADTHAEQYADAMIAERAK